MKCKKCNGKTIADENGFTCTECGNFEKYFEKKHKSEIKSDIKIIETDAQWDKEKQVLKHGKKA